MRLISSILLMLGGATLALAQPSITEVGPAASYLPTGAPGSGIAQGSFFYIKGSNLGPATGVVFTAGSANYTIGVDLGGTRVKVQMGGTVLDAFPYYASAAQVNVILPSNTPVGSGTVTVLYNGAQGVFPITVVRAAYGIFTLNSAGNGPAVVTDALNGQVITFTNALNPGQRGTLWGTGLGAVTFPDNQPVPGVTRLENGVTMLIGGQPATIEYAGRSPNYSGLDQINFIVPAGVSGCGVPLVVRIANLASNFATIPVAASGKVCSDPGGLSASDLSAAQAGGLSVGAISLNRFSLKATLAGQSITSISDSAGGVFSKYDFNSLIRTNSLGGPSIGNCVVNIYRGQGSAVDAVLPTYLDAGAKLTLNGPGGVKDITKSNGIYSLIGSGQSIPGLPGGIPGVISSTFLDPGQYTISGTGGLDVGAFSANITLPTALVWTNQAAITTVARSQNLPITWSGGGASDVAIITGYSYDPVSSVTGGFTCYGNASAGGFTVPSYILSALPQSSGFLFVGAYSQGTRFNATGVNYGVLTYSVTNGANVSFQ